MSIWGAGPKIGLLTLLYATVAGAATLRWPALFTIGVIAYPYLAAAAALLLLASVPLYLAAIVPLRKAYAKDRLVTGGAYAVCRHPLYAMWILLIMPAVALLLKSWLFLSTAAFMYAVARIEIRREETYLEERFGRQYVEYKRRVNAIFPKLWR